MKKTVSTILAIAIAIFIGLNELGIDLSYGHEDIKPTLKTEGNINVYFIDVGQADAILIQNKDENMLIDAGNNEDGELLVNYFNTLNITNFKYVVGTHAHEDHIGGMDNIINNFDIETFYMPDALTTTKTFEEVLDSLDKKGYSYNIPKIDSTFTLSDATFTVLYTGTDTKDLNDSSIVLLMEYGKTKVLFTGDATTEVEEQILNKNIAADVLKVGHHGSEYSTSQVFLDKVNPKYAIIQVGHNNTYEHPRKLIIDRLKNKNITIYRTDEDGTILMTSDGENITFNTFETETNK